MSVAISKPPFIKFKEPLSGSDVDVLNIIKSKLGFENRFKFERSWMGSASSVNLGASIMSIGHQPYEHMWSTYAEFTRPVYAMDIRLIAAKPKPLPG